MEEARASVAASRERSLSDCLEGYLCGRSQQRTSFGEKKTE